MNTASESVLELLNSAEHPLPAVSIVFILKQELTDPPSRPTIYRAVEPLVAHGLVERLDNADGADHYRITDRGRAYLAGELDADELEE